MGPCAAEKDSKGRRARIDAYEKEERLLLAWNSLQRQLFQNSNSPCFPLALLLSNMQALFFGL
jgi:hypothetical protein